MYAMIAICPKDDIDQVAADVSGCGYVPGLPDSKDLKSVDTVWVVEINRRIMVCSGCGSALIFTTKELAAAFAAAKGSRGEPVELKPKAVLCLPGMKDGLHLNMDPEFQDYALRGWQHIT